MAYRDKCLNYDLYKHLHYKSTYLLGGEVNRPAGSHLCYQILYSFFFLENLELSCRKKYPDWKGFLKLNYQFS